MVNTPASQARFSVMVNGRVAQVQAATVPAVLALDEAHDHLVNARVVAVSLPSQRWHLLLDEITAEALSPQPAPAGSVTEVGEHADRFSRGLFIAAAAFLAAEANDLEDRISLVGGDQRQKEICGKLEDIAHEVGDAADALIEGLEDSIWRRSSEDECSESDPSQLNETRQPPRLRYRQAIGRIVLPAVAGSLGVVIAVFVDNLRRNAPLTMVIMVSAGLLICLGLLLGASWTGQALQAEFRRRAQERRKLNEEWQEIRTARHYRSQCPRCRNHLSEQDSYLEPTVIEELPYDDDWQEYVK
jgi:hypothetical protein